MTTRRLWISLFCLGMAFGPACMADNAWSAERKSAAPDTKDTIKDAKDSSKKSASGPMTQSMPTRITADGMTYEADALQVTFNKNVHVSRPDFELWANKLTVYLKPAKKKSGPETADEKAASPEAKNGVAENKGSGAPDGLAAGDIDRLVASGDVRMKRDKHTSTSDKATYTMDTGVLLLEGDPRLTDGENVITGEVVKYYMRENRSEVESGGKKRVEAVFSTSNKPTREGAR